MEDKVRRIVRSWPWSLAASVACGLAVAAGVSGAGWAPASSRAAAYFEESDPAVSWRGSWSTNRLPANSAASARLAMEPGSQASFAFSGHGVSWIGYRDEWCGIANVSVDGVLQATVDTYARPARAQATLYTITGLSGGSHTLTIEATGTHGEASAGSWVWVDAFSLPQSSSGAGAQALSFASARAPSAERAGRAARAPRTARARPRGPERIEQDDPAVTWSGTWSSNRLGVHSAGGARLSMDATASVSLVFTGSAVSWIGYRDEWAGIADVLLDGRLRARVDTYASPARAQAVLFVIDGLPYGTHTLTIEPADRRRPASGGSWVWVDAFAIRP